jgi:spermidine synthase
VRKLLLGLSFLEGAAVMVAELIGAKMLAPWFGSSLYVWSSVMAITLGGLAAGYFAGGILSTKKNVSRNLYLVLLLASIFLLLMPFLSKTVLVLFGALPLMIAIVICTLLFLLPPVFFMGMVSPLIISLLTEKDLPAGRASGTVYAVSTVGGILATFLTGFYIIPEFGLSIPCLFLGVMMGVIPAFKLMRSIRGGVALWMGVILWSIWKQVTFTENAKVPILYNEEGLLGQVMVVDYPLTAESSGATKFNRTLFVNRITQAQLNQDSLENPYLDYIRHLTGILGSPEKKDKILLCGLGGGGLAKHLHESGYTVEVVELDPRIRNVAREYFGLPREIEVIINDSRYFIRNSDKKYDLIILDVFRGEEIPSHCFTLEAINEMKAHLTPGGSIIVNGNGYWRGARGVGMRSVDKTFRAAGLATAIVPTSDKEDWRNILFFASGSKDWKSTASKLGYTCLENSEEDVHILTDDKPVLDLLCADGYAGWRNTSIQYFKTERERGRNFPVFH